jgi:hypothetical protein
MGRAAPKLSESPETDQHAAAFREPLKAFSKKRKHENKKPEYFQGARSRDPPVL